MAYLSLRMILSDLPSPAEAGFALGSGLWPARAQAPAGNRFPPTDQVRGQAFRDHASCTGALATLHPTHRIARRPAALELNMRAETQNLVEEIKQSVRLLRRHL
jgi:hypothetical protein